jgi:pimeloyl-ACP methyl ester carboxylesterase
LHGWLDNAASFDVIAPLLHADIVAVDLAGHGHSYHRPPQASYNIWEDIPDILRLADLLQWPTFSVMGHSRGAIISTVLAAAMPERIESVVLLDGLRPNPVPENDFVDQLGLFLREHLAPPRPPVIYDSIGKAITVRCRTGGMSEASAALIVRRGLAEINVDQTHRAWQWRHDPRLRFASAVKMSQENIDAVMSRLATMPHRVYFADRGGAIVLRQFGEVERWSRELNFEISFSYGRAGERSRRKN